MQLRSQTGYTLVLGYTSYFVRVADLHVFSPAYWTDGRYKPFLLVHA